MVDISNMVYSFFWGFVVQIKRLLMIVYDKHDKYLFLLSIPPIYIYNVVLTKSLRFVFLLPFIEDFVKSRDARIRFLQFHT